MEIWPNQKFGHTQWDRTDTFGMISAEIWEDTMIGLTGSKPTGTVVWPTSLPPSAKYVCAVGLNALKESPLVAFPEWKWILDTNMGKQDAWWIRRFYIQAAETIQTEYYSELTIAGEQNSYR